MTEPQVGPPATRVLRRSRSDRIVGGVCGGLGRYFGVDPVLIRIVVVALALTGGAGVLAYLIAWVVIPEEAEGESPSGPPRAASSTVTLVFGSVLVVLGALLLLRELMPWFSASVIWPSLVVLAGALIIASARSHR